MIVHRDMKSTESTLLQARDLTSPTTDDIYINHRYLYRMITSVQ